MRITLPVLLSIAVAPSAYCFPNEVTVQLFGAKPPSDRIVIRGPVRLVEPTNRFFAGDVQIKAIGREVEYNKTHARSVTFVPACPAITVQMRDARRSYKGAINVTANEPNRLTVRNRVPFRDYIKSVVGSETDPGFASEALKAQAICTQTLMARYKPGDALGDTTEKQAYLGQEYVRPAVSKAVDEVFGKTLMYSGLPATIYFHSTCAGGTSNGEEYFGLKPGAAPYLKSIDCNFCTGSPFFKTKSSSLPASKFPTGLPVVTRADNRGRPLEVKVGNEVKSGFGFWSETGARLGWDKIPGTRFSITSSRGGDVIFDSTGAGHGVGLCQWGAHGQAKSGRTYKQILEYYFPGTSVR